MTLLLDTHILLWAAFSPRSLSRRAASMIGDERNTILVSAASAWEIATKVRLGRLAEAEELERDFPGRMQEAGYTLLSIDVPSALRAARLPGEHKDPFDRMLAAQALGMDIAVISADAKLDQFGVRRVW